MPKESSSFQSFQDRLLEKFIIQTKIDREKIACLLQNSFKLTGVIESVLIDLKSGMILGSMSDENKNMLLISASNNEITRKTILMIESIDKKKNLKNITFTCSDNILIIYHLSVTKSRDFFLYLVADAQKTNLALIHSQLESIDMNIEL
ncbi:MAG: hypothetical protein Q9M39_01585 [Sulfurovum sp.]|nr:hypothetical protein [Sulfurovum sp.]